MPPSPVHITFSPIYIQANIIYECVCGVYIYVYCKIFPLKGEQISWHSILINSPRSLELSFQEMWEIGFLKKRLLDKDKN